MASIMKRGLKWRAQVRTDGINTSRSFDTKSEAEAWAFSMENNRVHHFDHTPGAFREVLVEYLKKVTSKKPSAPNETIIINKLLQAAWVDIPLTRLSALHLTEYRDQRLEEVKPSTLKRQFDILHHAVGIAVSEWNWDVPVDLIRRIKVKVPPPTALRRVTQDELQQFFDACRFYTRNMMIAPVVRFALETALRKQELVDLQWEWVDFERGIIHANKTKTGYVRRIPMSPVARELLELLAQRATVTTSGKPAGSVFGMSAQAITLSFTRIKKRAGTEFRFHDLRHEAISRFFEMEMSPIEVASISGHRTLKQLMRYSHADTERLVAKMQEKLS